MYKRASVIASIAVVGLLAAGGAARAATKTWTGASDTSWSTPGNWSPSGVPGTSDAVVIDDATSNVTLNIDANVDVASITIQGGYTKDINPNSNQTIRVRGNLTLNSSSANYSFQFSSVTTQIDGNVSISQGTLKGNGGPVHILGNLTQTGGTINALAGVTLQIDGNLSQSAGTLTGNTGAIEIGGDLGPLSGGTFKGSSTINWVGGAFNRTSTNNTFNANNADFLFNATSAKTHLFNGAQLARVVFNDGLYAYWNFDEDANTTLNDSSDYFNTGTASNLTWSTASPPPLAFQNTSYGTFNGLLSVVSATVAHLPAANAAQTISVWAKITGLPLAASSLVSLTGASSAVKLGLSNTNLRVLRNDGTALIQTAAPSIGAWHHIAYTWDGTTNNLYVDGTAVTPTATTHDGGAVTGAFLGATSALSEFFSGSLDEVRIYNRALGACDIAALAFGRMPATGVATHTLSDGLTANRGNNIGDFVIASGIVTGPGTITAEGDWRNWGGRFTGTGLVTLAATNNSPVILSGGEPFTNLTLATTGVYTLMDRLWVSGTLSLSISGSAANCFADGGYVAHAGTFTTARTNSYNPGTGTIVLDGTSNQTTTQASFNNLRVEDTNETGLAGYWKLDEGRGAVVRDYSGNGNTGAASATGAVGTTASTTIGFDNAAAMNFDGTTGYVSAGTTGLPAANAAQTISAWVNITALPGSASSIVALTGSASAVKLGLSSTNLRVLRNDGTVLIQTSAPSIGAWHHVAFTWNGSTANNLYVDGTAVAPTATAHDGAAVTGAFIGATSAAADFFNGKIDDVRVYTQALTATQIARLAAGTYAGTGVGATVTLGTNTTVTNTLAVDAGGLATSTFTLAASLASPAAQINGGTYTVGSAAQTFSGGLTVASAGTLTMATSGGSVQIGNGKTLTIDGTLNASSTGATITRSGGAGSYAFQIGSTATATPTLNITGLAVQRTDGNGMQINVNQSAVTTFTRFDNIVFSNGTGTRFLQVFAKALYLASNGCTFDSGATTGTTTFAVTLAGNGSNGSPDTTETRAVFGKTTCANNWTVGASDRSCLTIASGTGTTAKSDDDADGNGVGNTPASNGAVVQFVRGAESDTAGTIVGFPTAAFDWNTFTYYSTYAAYNTASGTSPVIYVRDTAGNAKYAWTGAAGETIVGTPRWITVGTTHYLYVAVASGKVYRLIDNGSSSLTQDGAWAPFDCSCTIVTPLAMDASNLYWGGTASGAQKLWTLSQTTETQPMGSPFTVTPTITSTAPALWTSAGTSYLFLAVVGHLLEVNVSNQTLAADNTNPGTASIWGRIAIGTKTTNRILAGDDGGNFWSIDPSNFGGTNKQWVFPIPSDTTKSSPFYDYGNDAVYFGTEGGRIYALAAATGAALANYPITPGTSSDSIRAALLYFSGVIAAGTTTGKVFFIDRNNGTGPAFIREYYFGPTESVSGIAFDASTSRYMVSTSDPSTNDGKLYYIDIIPDPTSGSI